MTSDIDQRLADPARTALFGRVVQGLGWKGISQLAAQVTKTVVTIVLAQMLGPEQFGIAAMVIVLSSLAVPLADFGLGFALVQRKSITETDRSTVFWASVALGLSFTLAGIALSPLVGRFYGESEVTVLFAVMSIIFLITGLGCTQRSLLARAMDFRSLELRMIAGNFLGATVGIGLAVAGAGAWAIVGQFLSAAVASTILLWVLTPWHPAATFSFRNLRELGGFGGRYVGASTLRTANQNVDNVLVGRFLGASDLGLYALAYSVILVPISRIVSPFQQVFGPAFLRLQDAPAEIAAAWIRGTRLIAACSIPLMIGIAVTAPDLVLALFGARWERSIPVLQILAWVSLLHLLQTLHPAVLVATDGMSTYLRFNALSLVVNFAAFVLGLRWGIVGVAACLAISSTALALALTHVTARSAGVALREPLSSLRRLWQPAIMLLLAAEAVRHITLAQGIGAWGRIGATAIVGAAVYAVVAAVSAPDIVREVRGLTRRAVRSGRQVSVPAPSKL